MTSCIFQLNRRWLPKKMSLLRVIDRRYETSEIFIKLDEESDENWIMLVYLKDNNPNSDIIVEDKTDSEKSYSLEYKTNEIFKFSDKLVDSLTNMIDKEYKKKLVNYFINICHLADAKYNRIFLFITKFVCIIFESFRRIHDWLQRKNNSAPVHTQNFFTF